MNSMTGYGRAQVDWRDRSITVEVSSVNRRNLEVSVSLPREWQAIERVIGETIRARFSRGKFHVQTQVSWGQGGTSLLDKEAVLRGYREIKAVAEAAGESFSPDGVFWLRLINFSEGNQPEPAWEEAGEAVEGALIEALDALAQMRLDEGSALAADLRQRLQTLQGWLSEIEVLAQTTPVDYREALMERLARANLDLDINDERVLKEIAIFADRTDVSEEITRLASHLQQFATATQVDGSIGRKMDFICQEINRELNTIGSKANQLEITRLVIESKNELERLREQVQNIE